MRTGSFAADIVALIKAREQDRAEVNRPDPIVDFFETDGVVVERIGEVQQPGLKTNRAGISDAFDEEVARIVECVPLVVDFQAVPRDQPLTPRLRIAGGVCA